MKYKVALHTSEEGVSVSVPGLPGCWSQGTDEEEALANIGEAIREYLPVVDQLLDASEVREIELAVQPCLDYQASTIWMQSERWERLVSASRDRGSK